MIFFLCVCANMRATVEWKCDCCWIQWEKLYVCGLCIFNWPKIGLNWTVFAETVFIFVQKYPRQPHSRMKLFIQNLSRKNQDSISNEYRHESSSIKFCSFQNLITLFDFWIERLFDRGRKPKENAKWKKVPLNAVAITCEKNTLLSAGYKFTSHSSV